MIEKIRKLLSGPSSDNNRSTVAREESSRPSATRSGLSGDNWVWERANEYPYDHYTDTIKDIKQLKREKTHDEVEELLLWCIDFVEAESKWEQNQGYGFAGIAPAYYRHLAIVYRKDDRYNDEVGVLTRYAAACESIGTSPQEGMKKRLERAQELAPSQTQIDAEIGDDAVSKSSPQQREIRDLENEDLKDILQRMDDYDFEHFIADLWEIQGWNCTVSQASMDAGIDVTATKSSPYPQKKLIQAKRYGPNTTVGGPDIQQYASLKHQQPDADSVVVVTSNRFTNSAEKRAQDLNVKLVDGDSLESLVHKLDSYDVLREYAPYISESDTAESNNVKTTNTETDDSVTESFEATDISSTAENESSTVADSMVDENAITPNQSPDWLESIEQNRRWHRIFPKSIVTWIISFLVIGFLEGTGVGVLSSLASLVIIFVFLPLIVIMPVIWYIDMRYVRSKSDWNPYALAYLVCGLFFPYITIPLYYYRRYKTIGI